MDAFVTGPRSYTEPDPLKVAELWICQDFPFYWDGTGYVYIAARAPITHAPVNFEYWGWGDLTISTWHGSLSWQYDWGWRATMKQLAGSFPVVIAPGLNLLSWYMHGIDGGFVGVRPEIWICGTGIRPGRGIDVGEPQFQFQIGEEPPGTP
jgi:hypothetical protein